MKKSTSLITLIAIALLINNNSIQTASTATPDIIKTSQDNIKKAHAAFDISKKSIFDTDSHVDEKAFAQWKAEVETTISLLKTKASSFPSSPKLLDAAKISQYALESIEKIIKTKNKELVPLLKADIQKIDEIIKTITSENFYWSNKLNNDKKIGKNLFLSVLAPTLKDIIHNISSVPSSSAEHSRTTPESVTKPSTTTPAPSTVPVAPPVPKVIAPPSTTPVTSVVPAAPSIAAPTPSTKTAVIPQAPPIAAPTAPTITTTPKVIAPAPTPVAPPAPPLLIAPAPTPTATQTDRAALLTEIENQPKLKTAAEQKPLATQPTKEDLLSQIKEGKTLKKASEQRPLAAPKPKEKSLLTEIREGKTLKKVEQPSVKPPVKQESLDPYGKILSNIQAPTQRRGAKSESTGDEWEEEKEEETPIVKKPAATNVNVQRPITVPSTVKTGSVAPAQKAITPPTTTTSMPSTVSKPSHPQKDPVELLRLRRIALEGGDEKEEEEEEEEFE